MASVKLPLTRATAVEFSIQKQHADIDPGATTFLGQSIDGIWQRVQAQPSTYVFTREEFAVFAIFNYYRGVFSENEIAQQAVQRFWEHYGEKEIEDEEQASRSYSSGPLHHVYAKRATMHLPPMKGNIALQQEQKLKMQTAKAFSARPEKRIKGRARPSFTTASAKTVSKGIMVGLQRCQRCRTATVKCDGKELACTSCDRAGMSAECTYIKRKKDERFVVPNYNVDESKEFHGNTSTSTYFKLSQDKLSENLKITLPKESQTEENRSMVSLNSSFERQKEQTSQMGKVDHGQLEFPENFCVDPSQFRMHISNGKEYSLINSIKLYVEYLTGELWDWWPLRPSLRQLLEDEIRVLWHCVSRYPLYLNPGLLIFERIRNTRIGQCSPKMVLFPCKRLSKRWQLFKRHLQRESSQNQHQKMVQVQLQTQVEAQDQSRPSGGRHQRPQRVAHLISRTTRQAPGKTLTHQVRVS